MLVARMTIGSSARAVLLSLGILCADDAAASDAGAAFVVNSNLLPRPG
jgi:hypothetical protein